MQYVVIFKARIRTLDELYFSTAQQLRDKALTHCKRPLNPMPIF
ncbi:hypothetical protein [Acinetobacter sp. YH12040]